MTWLGASVAGLALLAGSGCPGRLRDKERFLGDAGGGCGDVVANIFIPKCGASICHDATEPQQGLDLVSANVAARVVGVTATGCAATLGRPRRSRVEPALRQARAEPSVRGADAARTVALSDEEAACILASIARQ